MILLLLLLLLYLTVYGIPEDVFLESSVFSQNITEVKLCTKTCSGCEIRANLLLSFFLSLCVFLGDELRISTRISRRIGIS
jgi:hypothetical protein